MAVFLSIILILIELLQGFIEMADYFELMVSSLDTDCLMAYTYI